MAQPTSYRGRFEAADQIKTLTITLDVAATRDTPAFRFPAPGRVLGAYFTSGFSSSGTNLLQIGIRNGGPSGVGTVQTAAASTGTVTAGSVTALVVASTGPEIFAAGDWLLLNATSTLANTDAIVQVDYVIDPV